MIPGTLLGVLFLAACLVPGFIFLRIGERRRARLTRSPLVEAVELAGVGAFASLIAVMAVLTVDREWWNFLDAPALADDPGRYVLLHPVRGVGSLVASLALSCIFAAGVARLVFARQESVFKPASSTWLEAFYEGRPSDKPIVMATVELADGRIVAGQVGSFSAQLDENRELALRAQLAASPGAGQPLTSIDGDFIVIRDKQIVTITGSYIGPAQPGPAGGQ